MNFNQCFAHKLRLAQAYIPFQEMGKIYELEEGFNFGTIFPELNFPYKPAEKNKCHCQINSKQEEF